jgi:hypothetical protein
MEIIVHALPPELSQYGDDAPLAKKQMAHLPFSALYQSFQKFDAAMPGNWADFECLEPGDTLRLIPDAAATAFEAIGMTNSASLLAFWQEPGRATDERPIVYIDSEGSPVGVFAASFAEFLTLLPYGLEFIYRLITRLIDLQKEPDLQGIYYHEITSGQLQTVLAEHQQQYPWQTDYRVWLATVAGLAVASDPLATIRTAFDYHANLEEWLSHNS